ncbi:MAG TPA: metallopeptidase family protein [Thermomicrobiales bacterium]|nr:metallopeptidase family protein [Thermomicrobiales bacterium]
MTALDGGREHFDALVAAALDELPDEILDLLDNVDVVVADAPTPEQLRDAGLIGTDDVLLGLYEGIPLTERTSAYNLVLPDKITLFQRALEAISPDEETLRREVQTTVVHELAHHFGISDRRLAEMGWA